MTASMLFDVASDPAQRAVEQAVEYVPLEQIELAENPRRDIEAEGIDRLAEMLMRSGQLVPCIGRRVGEGRIVLYAGQRRLRAAQRSHELAGGEGYEELAAVRSLVVTLIGHEPSAAEIRRLQAQENRREELSMRDQQEQFRDCYTDRRGLPEDARMAAVCADLGIDPRRAHNLRRQLTLPEEVRTRVAERPAGDRISVTLANRLADMHAVAPELCQAAARRITSPELHAQATQDLGAFVARTVVEDASLYALRVEEGEVIGAHALIERARGHIGPDQEELVLRALRAEPKAKLEEELDGLAARAKHGAVLLRVDEHLRDRAVAGGYAWRFDRGEDFAASVWVVDPVFAVEAAAQAVGEAPTEAPAAEQTYFKGSSTQDEEVEEARVEVEGARKAAREAEAQAAGSNLGIGQDIGAGLVEPTEAQMGALRDLLCHLIARDYADVVAYGAGWSDRERQQPVGDSKRFEPREPRAIVEAELERALGARDPMAGVAHLLARFGAAFLVDPQGVRRTKALGSERMGRKLTEALPSGDRELRRALWAFMRPMISPAVAERNRDAFAAEEDIATTVDLEAHRGDSGLEDLDLDEGLG